MQPLKKLSDLLKRESRLAGFFWLFWTVPCNLSKSLNFLGGHDMMFATLKNEKYKFFSIDWDVYDTQMIKIGGRRKF